MESLLKWGIENSVPGADPNESRAKLVSQQAVLPFQHNWVFPETFDDPAVFFRPPTTPHTDSPAFLEQCGACAALWRR